MVSRMILAIAAAAMLAAGAVASVQIAPPMHAAAPVQSSETPRQQAEVVVGEKGEAHIEWGYTGPNGPDHWAEMSEDYAICSRGQQESPVDLRDPVAANLGKLDFGWRPVPLRVANNGHTIQIDTPPGGRLRMGGKTYALQQVHFHHPSEHLLNGRRFPLELHFVHRGPAGVLGVVGVLVAEGRANAVLQPVLAAIPAKRGATVAPAGRSLDVSALLPRSRAFYRYEGSLTTPPCSENVDWAVLREPIEASAAQINAFEKVYPFNARPIQALNRRFLLLGR